MICICSNDLVNQHLLQLHVAFWLNSAQWDIIRCIHKWDPHSFYCIWCTGRMATASIITLDQVTLKMDTTDKGWQTGAWIPYNNMELPSSPGPPASRFFFLTFGKKLLICLNYCYLRFPYLLQPNVNQNNRVGKSLSAGYTNLILVVTPENRRGL